MIFVTGGVGFIGSNLVKGLNDRGFSDIVIVDDLKNTQKAMNLRGLHFMDYVDRWDFLRRVECDDLDYYAGGKQIEAVMHQGACASMTEPDGLYLMKTNYEFTKALFICCRDRYPFIYASTTAVYEFGFRHGSITKAELPRNLYGMSKLMADRWIFDQRGKGSRQVVGLRYFCVYGPGEQHKGNMASIVTKANQQINESGEVRLFKGFDGYANGEHRRDFTHVSDLVKVNLWFFTNPEKSGIYEVGTGVDRSFNEVVKEVIKFKGKGKIRYIDPPAAIIPTYQSFSRSDNTDLIGAGYNGSFLSVEEGVARTLRALGEAEAKDD